MLIKNFIKLKKTKDIPIKPNSPRNSTKSECAWFANWLDKLKNFNWNKFSNDPDPYPKKIKFLNSINPNFIISNLDISLISPEIVENSSLKK